MIRRKIINEKGETGGTEEKNGMEKNKKKKIKLEKNGKKEGKKTK